jgi:putative head protein|nr:MAG TPA: minor capsid protein [Caudoviricetes sp.]
MKNRRGLPSDEYWRERAEDRLDEAEKLSVPYLEDIHTVYDDAKIKIVEDIKNLYKNYYKDDEGFDQEKLRVIIPNGDLERFHREMKKAGLSEYLPDNYKARMTRLEYLYADCWAESKKASLKHQQIEAKAHRETIKNAYYRTIYDTGVGLKVNPAFSKLDNRAVNQVLNTKFLGGNYSERIWKNTDKLADTLKEVIGSAIARGESYSKTARGIRERFGVTQYEATRLVQTETCYFQNQAEIEALKEMGIKKYKFIATLDSRTSDICRVHDKKVYNVEDAKAGENLPPLHPNCRSTVSAYLGEEYESAIRVARNENGENEYVDNVPYGEWLKRIENGTLGREPIVVKPNTTNNISNDSVISPSVTTKTTSQKDYIGGRKHLLPLIEKMEDYNEITKKFANVLSGSSKEETLGVISGRAAKALKIKPNTKIVLLKSYLLHMDNSGHFTGKGYGKNGHDDTRPLRIHEISSILRLIQTASREDVINLTPVRGNKRYAIVRQSSRYHYIGVEFEKTNNRINLVTAYNLSRKKFLSYKRQMYR